MLGCDFLISATGVQPNSAIFTHSVSHHHCNTEIDTTSTTTTAANLACTEEGYIMVDNCMRTSIDNVFAAGDCCEYPICPVDVAVNGGVSHFFQMRLWTQVCCSVDFLCCVIVLTSSTYVYLTAGALDGHVGGAQHV